ncbi:MAG: hypothetical protein ACOY3P_08310, partial [Planctomycetota bacterium]
MNRLTSIVAMLLLSCLPTLNAANAAEQGIAASASGQNGNPANDQGLQAFLGAPLSLPTQQLWKGRGGTSIVTAQDGTVIAFRALGSNMIRRSTDGGRTWDVEIEIGPEAS